MKLYLIQHGIAKTKVEDPDRSLTDEGEEQTRKVARFIAPDVTVSRILHSGKIRARQTAQIFAEVLKTVDALETAKGLDPLDDPQIQAARLAEESGNWMLVGHLPHLNRLASLLLCGDPRREPIAFRNSGVVCLARDEEGKWSLQWAVTPEVVG
jgi:phosphohistidine phosphatase